MASRKCAAGIPAPVQMMEYPAARPRSELPPPEILYQACRSLSGTTMSYGSEYIGILSCLS